MIKNQCVIILKNKNITNLIFRYGMENIECIPPERKRLEDYLSAMGAE